MKNLIVSFASMNTLDAFVVLSVILVLASGAIALISLIVHENLFKIRKIRLTKFFNERNRLLKESHESVGKKSFFAVDWNFYKSQKGL
jgi:hypothetical protein